MKLSEIYREIQWIDESLLDEDYPSTWDAEAFAALPSFAARVRYANDNLNHIKAGSGRRVYQIDNQKVLKLAKNPKGIAQNEAEVQLSEDSFIGGSDGIFGEVFSYDEKKYTWVEMELARKCIASKFKAINGYSFDHFTDLLQTEYGQRRVRTQYRRSHDVPEDVVEMIYESDFWFGITDYVGNYDPPIGDFTRLSSYGIVDRGTGDEVIIIDYGLTDDVLTSYYS